MSYANPPSFDPEEFREALIVLGIALFLALAAGIMITYP